MRIAIRTSAIVIGAWAAALVGCSSGKNSGPAAPPAATLYALTVASNDPSLGVPITASPADFYGKTGGSTSLALFYKAGTAVTLTAPATSGTTVFSSWSGCSGPSGIVCALL